MKKVGLALVGALIGAAALVGGCDSDDDGDQTPVVAPDLSAARSSAIDEDILPAVRLFVDQVQALQGAVQSLCAQPTVAGLESTREAWRLATRDWNGVLPYNLGPLDDDLIYPAVMFVESKRPRGADYTQTVRETLSAAVSSSVALDASYFDALTFNRVGLLALEVGLFETAATGTTAVGAVLTELQAQPRKCAFLVGVGARLKTRAESILAGWTVSFEDGLPFSEQLRSGSLSTGSGSVAALTVAWVEYLDYVKRRKLETTLDGQISGYAYPPMKAGIEALSAFLGESGDATSFLSVLVAEGYEAEVTAVRTTLADTLAHLDAKERDLLIADYAALENFLRGTFTAGLQLNLGVTFSDGD